MKSDLNSKTHLLYPKDNELLLRSAVEYHKIDVTTHDGLIALIRYARDVGYHDKEKELKNE